MYLTAFCTTLFPNKVILLENIDTPKAKEKGLLQIILNTETQTYQRLQIASQVGREVQQVHAPMVLLTSVLENVLPRPLQNHPNEKEHTLTVVSKKHKISTRKFFKSRRSDELVTHVYSSASHTAGI